MPGVGVRGKRGRGHGYKQHLRAWNGGTLLHLDAVVMRLYEWFRHWNIVKQDVPFGGGEPREGDIGPLLYFFGIFCESVIIFVLIYKRNCYTCNDLDESLALSE